MKPTNLSKYITSFLSSYLPGLRNVSKNTIASYCDTFRLLLKYCRDFRKIPLERLSLINVNVDMITTFLNWLEENRGCSISTRNQRLAAIHSFFRYVQAEAPEYMLHCQKVLEVPFKKKGKPIMNYLTADDIKLILAQPNVTTSDGRRDLVLLCVLYDTGARVQEIADLVVRDIRLEYPAKIRLTGKGRKSREVPLLSRTASLLQNYLSEQKLTPIDKFDYPLFFNRQRTKLTRAGISYILDKYVQQAMTVSPLIQKTVSPHIFRHTKAMHLLQAGVNLFYIRDILGHVDIGTTEVYARADTEMKRTALEKVNQIESPSVPSWTNDTDLLSWLKEYGKPKV